VLCLIDRGAKRTLSYDDFVYNDVGDTGSYSIAGTDVSWDTLIHVIVSYEKRDVVFVKFKLMLG